MVEDKKLWEGRLERNLEVDLFEDFDDWEDDVFIVNLLINY